ncbi:MAG TPA: RHS repeat-associated core domain-containing protein, partial [Thermoanaerobaculia bacterium]|nr:RHS repeat-associated core domain-containing protein [Thermoanaerobaculia bacterium]
MGNRSLCLLAALAVSILSLPLPARGQPLTVNVAANPVGRLTSMGDGRARRFFEYDTLGRAVRVEHRLDGGAYVFSTAFGYPQGGGTAGPGTVPRTQTFPDGEVAAYGYDASGAQRTITATRPGTVTPQDVVRDVRRNARGQTVYVLYGNGTASTHTYNDATDLRLNRIQTTAGSGLLQDYLYGFDATGNVTSLADGVVAAFSATYAYDSLDRLTSMTSGSTFSYQYDSTGNLINKESAAQTYGGAGRGPHALATAGGATYAYDANGNLASTSTGLALTWNADNMATQASLGGVVQNRKSFLGEELWKKVEGGTTTLYLPSLLLENGVPRKFFGTFAERSPDGSLKFYHSDHLGSSTVVTDATQAVVHRIAYMPYGADRGVAGGGFTPRYQFNFKEKDATGFYDYGARLYSPATGRWLSADNAVSDGPNRYAYVADNPLTYSDPTGHDLAGIATGLILNVYPYLQIDYAARHNIPIAVFFGGIHNKTYPTPAQIATMKKALGVEQVIFLANRHTLLQAFFGLTYKPQAHEGKSILEYAARRGVRTIVGSFSNGVNGLSWAMHHATQTHVTYAYLLEPNTASGRTLE